MSPVARTLLESSYRTLLDGARLVAPDVSFDNRGYVAHWEQNLVPGAPLAEIERDLRAGAGQELTSKFLAAHSSSALAVNTFAPWRSQVLPLLGQNVGSFGSVHFEGPCPTGLQGTPPHLDVLAVGESVLAIESKCTEWMRPQKAEFSDSYLSLRELHQSPWFKHMLELRDAPRRYKHLGAAQLIKHAFGLLTQYPNEEVKLVYLFWEPTNAKQWQECECHRAEVEDFSRIVNGHALRFESLSYPELWEQWQSDSPSHLSYLQARYLRDA